MSNNYGITHSGLMFDFEQPDPSMIVLDDIVYGLSGEGRFANQSFGTITVAEHSCHVSDILRQELKLFGLLHDASEYVLGDVVKPLKNVLGEAYKRIEAQVQAMIYNKFCGRKPTDDERAEIKMADLRVMKAEVVAWMPYKAQEWPCLRGIDPAEVRVEKWRREKAQTAFMLRYVKLTAREA